MLRHIGSMMLIGKINERSDGSLPHSVNVQFRKRVQLSHVFFHVDIRKDESYCPCKVSLRVGSNFHDLQVCILSM